MRRFAAAVVALTSLTVGSVAHAQEGDASPPTTLDVQTTQITSQSEATATDDDDDSDNTGLWGLAGLLGLLGLAGLAGRKRRDAVTRGSTPPVGTAAPRSAQGATGTRDYDA
jgi:LPXTG-motif cell wall-anchored protein